MSKDAIDVEQIQLAEPVRTVDEFTDDLSDEALDRDAGKWCNYICSRT